MGGKPTNSKFLGRGTRECLEIIVKCFDKFSMSTNFIKLDQFLKLMNLAQTGGQAKLLIQEGHVSVNGKLELRRGRKLITGDQVTFENRTYRVDL
jgi:ribosome-associated protein